MRLDPTAIEAGVRLETLAAIGSTNAEARLRAAYERVLQRAKEGQVLPRSMGNTRAGARLPQSRSEATQELLFLFNRGKVEAWKRRSEPPALQPGESSVSITHP